VTSLRSIVRGLGRWCHWTTRPGPRTTDYESGQHSTLEFELRALEHFATKAAARARVAAWIEDYNTRRRHSALQMMSPVDYEQALTSGQAA